MKKEFPVLLILILFFAITSVARAQNASLYLSSSSGSFLVGSTFDISIFINTGGQNVNAVKVDLKFDPKTLQIASPTAGKSFISVWISQPTYSNIKGTASFQGGIPSPGIKTSSGLVSTITFRAITPGETVVSLLDSSQVLLDDGKGTNILSSLGTGVYNIVIPPPEGPKVFSPTHSDQNKWYKNNNSSFFWEKEEGVTDFSYSIDNSFYEVPDNIAEGDHTSVSYSDLRDGIWYFHIKAKKGNTWGGTSHYIVQIDTTPPAAFTLDFEPHLRSPLMTSREPIVSFITTDALSGLDHYELKVIDLTGASEKKEAGFFVEVATPYKLPALSLGEYEILVRAFDRALNFQDSSYKIEVISPEKIFYITKRGISIGPTFFYWQQLILILILPTVLVFIIASWRWKHHQLIHKRRVALERVNERGKKHGEKIKKELEETIPK